MRSLNILQIGQSHPVHGTFACLDFHLWEFIWSFVELEAAPSGVVAGGLGHEATSGDVICFRLRSRQRPPDR